MSHHRHNLQQIPHQLSPLFSQRLMLESQLKKYAKMERSVAIHYHLMKEILSRTVCAQKDQKLPVGSSSLSKNLQQVLDKSQEPSPLFQKLLKQTPCELKQTAIYNKLVYEGIWSNEAFSLEFKERCAKVFLEMVTEWILYFEIKSECEGDHSDIEKSSNTKREHDTNSSSIAVVNSIGDKFRLITDFLEGMKYYCPKTKVYSLIVIGEIMEDMEALFESLTGNFWGGSARVEKKLREVEGQKNQKSHQTSRPQISPQVSIKLQQQLQQNSSVSPSTVNESISKRLSLQKNKKQVTDDGLNMNVVEEAIALLQLLSYQEILPNKYRYEFSRNEESCYKYYVSENFIFSTDVYRNFTYCSIVYILEHSSSCGVSEKDNANGKPSLKGEFFFLTQSQEHLITKFALEWIYSFYALSKPHLIVNLLALLMIRTKKSVRWAMSVEYMEMYGFFESVGCETVTEALEDMHYFRELIIGHKKISNDEKVKVEQRRSQISLKENQMHKPSLTKTEHQNNSSNSEPQNNQLQTFQAPLIETHHLSLEVPWIYFSTVHIKPGCKQRRYISFESEPFKGKFQNCSKRVCQDSGSSDFNPQINCTHKGLLKLQIVMCKSSVDISLKIYFVRTSKTNTQEIQESNRNPKVHHNDRKIKEEGRSNQQSKMSNLKDSVDQIIKQSLSPQKNIPTIQEQVYYEDNRISNHRLELILKEEGLYVLEFDNSYSWLSSKELKYYTEVFSGAELTKERI